MFDPLAEWSVNGTLDRPLTTLFDEMTGLANWATSHAPQFKSVGIDVCPYAEAGASIAQELAIAVATAVEYLRAMIRRGVTLADAASCICFQLSVGADFFMEIAKLRALRTLWSNIVKAFGGDDESCKTVIHSVTTRHNKTEHDLHVNILRVTTEAYSAVLGGCDTLDVAPFDDILGLPDELSRRISRNIQAILKDECHGDKVIDPAGGAWYTEKMTQDLSKKAWELFQDIERAGGMVEALKAGLVQNMVANSARMEAQGWLHGRRSSWVLTCIPISLKSRKPNHNLITLTCNKSEVVMLENTRRVVLQSPLPGQIKTLTPICKRFYQF